MKYLWGEKVCLYLYHLYFMTWRPDDEMLTIWQFFFSINIRNLKKKKKTPMKYGKRWKTLEMRLGFLKQSQFLLKVLFSVESIIFIRIHSFIVFLMWWCSEVSPHIKLNSVRSVFFLDLFLYLKRCRVNTTYVNWEIPPKTHYAPGCSLYVSPFIC